MNNSIFNANYANLVDDKSTLPMYIDWCDLYEADNRNFKLFQFWSIANTKH